MKTHPNEVEDIEEITEAESTLLDLITRVEEGVAMTHDLQLQRAQLWENLAEVRQKQIEMYYGLIKEAQVELGKILTNMDHADIPHHAVVIHKKLRKVVQITEAGRK
jgi:uncharacterized protein YicC (UPF0701 family)